MIGRTEAARLLALSTSSFDRLRSTGKVGPLEIRVGSLARWNRLEFDAWLNLPSPAGELYDANTWPVIWKSLSKKPLAIAGS
jgi:hypothetical protein